MEVHEVKNLIYFLLSLLLIPTTFALNFSSDSISLCATDTAVFVAQVINDRNVQDSYTVSLSGDGAKWAVAAPAGFTLKPNQIEPLYIYVTPSITALAGTYDVEVTVSSFAKTEKAKLSINVLDCHSGEISAEISEQKICSAKTANYELLLKNTGKYKENFELSVSGIPKTWVEFSQNLISLNPKDSSQITLYVTPPADQTGVFKLKVTAASQNSRALATKELILNSAPCYTFTLNAEKNYIALCEGSEIKLPLSIENKGSLKNQYDLSIEGPNWVSLENSKFEIDPNSSASTNLVIHPNFGDIGTYIAKITATPKTGVAEAQSISINSKSCYSADLKLSRENIKICPNTENILTASLTNTGEFATRFALSVKGEDFVTLEKNFIDLNANSSETINIFINPKPENVGKKSVEIIADSQDSAKTSISKKLNLEIAALSECYGVEALAALTKVEVMPGEPALIPIIVTNKGLENSSYDIELSGDGAQFVQINPAALTIQGKNSKTIYAYIAVPEGTQKQNYKVSISVRMSNDAKIVSTTNFDIVVGKSTQKEKEMPVLMESQSNAIRQILQNGLTNLIIKLKTLANKFKTLKLPSISQKNEPVEIAETNVSFINNQSSNESTNISNYTNYSAFMQYVSPELLEKLNNTKNYSEKNESLENSALTRSESLSKIKTGVTNISLFLTATTYNLPNWLYILVVLSVLILLNYLIRRKDLVEKFDKFLNEEDEKIEETEKETKKPSAEEILKSTENKEKKRNNNRKKKNKQKKEMTEIDEDAQRDNLEEGV
ncbi:MAG: hypothetical protein QXQ79_00270 [Candidatus Nanoarchaeia archaeon]